MFLSKRNAFWHSSALLICGWLAAQGSTISSVRAQEEDHERSTEAQAEETSGTTEGDCPGFPLVMRISSEVLTRRIDKSIERVGDVREHILGTSVVGQATTKGLYQVSLVPSQKRAMFKITLSGRTVSNTNGTNGPVAINTTTTTDFRAAKIVAYDPDHGFYAGKTAIGSSTKSTTNQVDTHRRGIVKRIILRRAWEQIEASRCQADEIAQHNTERQITEAFDRAITEHLDHLNNEFDIRRFVAMTKRECQVCSTDRHILLHFGKGGELPQLPEQKSKAMIELCVHKSILGERLIKTIERADIFKDLLAVFQVPTPVPVNLEQKHPTQWAPTIVGLEEWIAIDLGQNGFRKVAAQQ